MTLSNAIAFFNVVLDAAQLWRNPSTHHTIYADFHKVEVLDSWEDVFTPPN